MMKVISFLCIFFSISAFACSLKESINLYSLAGPISMLLEELELTKEKSLKAISVFHPILNYTGEKFGGGQFLSHRNFIDHKKSILFYDKSRELTKNLKPLTLIKKIEINSLGQDPFEVTRLSISLIKKYTIKCDKKINKLLKEINRIENRVSSYPFKEKSYLFYLGEIKPNDKKPRLLIGQDGFVLSLVKNKSFKTYPSDLAYINWSQKIVDELQAKSIEIGVISAEKNISQLKKVKKNQYNFYFRGSLIPGIRQVRFLASLLDQDL